MRKCLLVDGTNLVMRYAFAMLGERAIVDAPDSDGEVRVMNAVERVMQEAALVTEATHMVVALDSFERSWRRQINAEYKAHRKGSTKMWSMRLALRCQEAGLFTAQAEGFEADDVIATLATRLLARAVPVAVLSQDSDLLVLTGIGADVYHLGGKHEARFVRRSGAWVMEKYGIATPHLLTDYKALVGEPGDNIPGVRGIGPVKAKKLLAEHGSIATMMGKGLLDDDQAQAMLALVALHRDLPLLPIAPAACRLRGGLYATADV